MDIIYQQSTHTDDQTVPVEWGKHAAFAASAKNHCDEPLGFFNEIDWSLYFYDGGVDLEEFNIVLDGFFASADTLEHSGAIERYQWSDGCHTEPNTEVIWHMMNGYYIPTIHSHGTGDQTVPVEWGKHAAFAASAKNHCDEPLGFFNEIDWSLYFYYGGVDLEEFNIVLDGFFASADTLEHSGAIERYQWSDGCHTEPNTEVILIPNGSHAWHQPWNSPISTPLEHWNFFRQFSKDKMGPVLDSLALPLKCNS